MGATGNGCDGPATQPRACGSESGRVTRSALRKLIDSQQYKCGLTGLALTPPVATCDHIQPVSRGGTNTINNIMVLHKLVNASKGTMTPIEFIGMCHVIVEYNNQFDLTEAREAFVKYASQKE